MISSKKGDVKKKTIAMNPMSLYYFSMIKLIDFDLKYINETTAYRLFRQIETL